MVPPEQAPDFRIRPARLAEAAALSALALRSKAHWGYDAAFMAACRAELTVTADHVRMTPVYVYEEVRRALGFYRLELRQGVADVALYFVDPKAIGQGVGRALWRHLLEESRRRDAHKVTIESDPNAEGFYQRMGARKVGTVPSGSIPGRTLALLEIIVSQAAQPTFTRTTPRSSTGAPGENSTSRAMDRGRDPLDPQVRTRRHGPRSPL